ncbi:hypothetical protein Cgig2_003063 [Carnegiea gigantea]|uniref:Protein BIC1-like n=1 Tax=Carnegiea gigantea TaxID=171969 RepID=A0A9Q1JPQ8_9CARY|nr:hypothetical protein Cgig2_003063 [Carnegiea gigantea]
MLTQTNQREILAEQVLVERERNKEDFLLQWIVMYKIKIKSKSHWSRKTEGSKPQRENHHKIHHESSAHEEQSSISSFRKCEHGEKEKKIKSAHEEMDDGEQPLTTIGVEMKKTESELAGPRERLKRHRTQVAGQVWIPDMWGQEDLLKDWIDCTAFDSWLVNHQDIMSARASLIEDGRRASSELRCYIN